MTASINYPEFPDSSTIFPDASAVAHTQASTASGPQLPLTVSRCAIPKATTLSVVQLPLYQLHHDALIEFAEGTQLAHADQRPCGTQFTGIGVCNQLPIAAIDASIPSPSLPLSDPNPTDAQLRCDTQRHCGVSGLTSSSRHRWRDAQKKPASAGFNFGGAA